MEVHKNKNGGIMVKKVILYLLTMIFALSTATALAAEPADAPVYAVGKGPSGQGRARAGAAGH